MSAKTKQIIKGVSIPEDDRVFVEGMEEELEAIMTPAQLKRLQETGSLAGDWNAKGKEHKMASARPDKVTPPPRKEKMPDITTIDSRSVPAAEAKPGQPKPK